MPLISIIIPTRNEADNIDLLLTRIFAVEELREHDFEVVFSDGASTDATCDAVRGWQDTNPVRLVESRVNEGLSAAVMAGARAAAGDYVVVMDADLSHPPESLPDMLEPLLSGSHDMVVGSRYVAGGSTRGWPLKRRISSLLASLPARILADVKDPLAGFLAMRRERLTSLNWVVCGFKFGLELLATAEEQTRVKEVPIVFHDRCYGKSKMGLGVILDYLRQLLLLAGIRPLPACSPLVFLAIVSLVLIADYGVLRFGLLLGLGLPLAHILSFISAMGLAGLAAVGLHRRRPTAAGNLIPACTAGYCAVALLVLFLRSGLVALLADHHGSLSFSRILAVVLSTAVVSYLANICFVFSIGNKRLGKEPTQRIYILGLVAFIVLLRLLYSGSIDLLPEERFYHQISGASGGLLSHGAAVLPGAAARLSTAVFGGSLWSFRLTSCVLWLIAAALVFRFSQDIENRSVAFRALLLFSLLPFFMGAGMFVSSDAVLIVLWLLLLFLVYRALERKSAGAWIWIGVVLGCALQYDNLCWGLAAGIPVYLTLGKEWRRMLTAKEFLLAAVACLFVWLPLMIAGAHVAVGDPYGGPPWLVTILGRRFGEGLLSWLPLLTPTALVGGLYCCLRVPRAGCVRSGSLGNDREKGIFVVSLFLTPLAVAALLVAIGAMHFSGAVSHLVGDAPLSGRFHVQRRNGFEQVAELHPSQLVADLRRSGGFIRCGAAIGFDAGSGIDFPLSS